MYLKNSYGQKATCYMGKLGEVSVSSFYRNFGFELHDDKFWVRCSGMYLPDSISMSLVNVPWEVVYSQNYTESQLDEILLKVTNLRDTHLVPFKREKLHDLTNGLNKFLRNSYGQKDPTLAIEPSIPGEFCLWKILKSETNRDIKKFNQYHSNI